MSSYTVLWGFFGMPGQFEFLILAFIILILFGNRLPSVMRSLGSGIVEFKKGLHEIEDDPADPAAAPKEEAPKESITSE